MPSVMRSNNLAAGALAVVLSIAALCVPVANSFVVPVEHSHSHNSHSHSHISHSNSRPDPSTANTADRFRGPTTALRASGFSSAETDGGDALKDSVSVSLSAPASVDRRSVLLGGASATAGWFVLHQSSSNTYNKNNKNNNLIDDRLPEATLVTTTTMEEDQSSAPGSIVAPTTTAVSSVEEALAIIESIGDKRFLHAVVASDYRFLYELPSDVDADAWAIFSRTEEASAAASAAASPFPPRRRIRSIVPAVTGSLAPPRAPSLWPLEKPSCASAAAFPSDSCGRSNGIHYAWPASGGMFPATTTTATANSNTNTNAVIVDGIDCGKMSLEDALEGDTQVLVQAPTYLVVPAHMESNLRHGLRGAFLI